jgi:Na+-translocating ferredoxin:NAD+ oxidoreductase subunit B
MMKWAVLIAMAVFAFLSPWLRRRFDPVVERSSLVPRWPSLRVRGRLSRCDMDPGDEGYGTETVAVVNCHARQDQHRSYFQLAQPGSCLDSQMQGGGELACDWACLGHGDCTVVCDANAIHMERGLAVIDAKACNGCGDCVSACPRQVISLIPSDAQFYAACGNAERLSDRLEHCEVACQESERCLEDRFLDPGLVLREDDRPVIDYSRSANLLPLKAVCPQSIFKDRVPHRPWFTVNSACTGCGDCLPVCPADPCIIPEGEPADTKVGHERVRILQEHCVGCGLCLPVCKPMAIQVVGAYGHELNRQSHLS